MPDDRTLREELEAAFSLEEATDDKAATGNSNLPDADAPTDDAAPEDSGTDSKPTDDVEGKPDSESEKPEDKKPKYSYREPPSRWSKEAKEQWAKAFGALDMENPTHKQIGALRDLMFQRAHESEEEFAKRTAEFEARARSFDAISKVVEPFRASIEQAGSTVEREISELLRINAFATQRPDEFVRWFVQARGMNPVQIFGLAAAPQPQQAPPHQDDDPLGLIPPQYKQAVALVPQLNEKIAVLERQLQQFGGQFQGYQQQAQQQMNAQALEYVTSWSQEKDANGNLLRPHYSDPAVKSAMLHMLESKVHTDINAAYEAAVWSNPTVRQRMLDSQHAARVAEAERKQREAAAAKRQAAVSVGGRPATSAPSTGENVQAMSLRDQLSSGWDEMLGG